MVIGLFLLIGCKEQISKQPILETASISIVPITSQIIKAQPIDHMLTKLGDEAQTRLAEFTATVPDPLPNDLAYPLQIGFLPKLSRASGKPNIVSLTEGKIKLEGMLANPGSNFEQTNIICLRNESQIPCSPEADVWSVVLEPKTLAIVHYEIEAMKGDRLTMLYIANNETKRLYMASIMDWVFVEEDPTQAIDFVQMPAVDAVYPNCDFSLTSVATNTTYQAMPGIQKRGTPLTLLIQTCAPIKDELVRFVPIINREQVVDLPGDIWHKPVRLANPATLIPIDTAPLGDATEFQIAVVPLVDSHTSTPEWWGWFPFTQAVGLTD